MKKYYLLISLFIFLTETNASIKENIINNLKDINNIQGIDSDTDVLSYNNNNT